MVSAPEVCRSSHWRTYSRSASARAESRNDVVRLRSVSPTTGERRRRLPGFWVNCLFSFAFIVLASTRFRVYGTSHHLVPMLWRRLTGRRAGAAVGVLPEPRLLSFAPIERYQLER